jgi:hypothetical protein
MEEELDRSEQRARQLDHERGRLADRAAKIGATLTELAAEIDVALGAGSDDLARKLIKRKLETARLAAHVAERRAAGADALQQCTAVLREQRERLDVMRQKAELLLDAPVGGDDWSRSDFAVGDDEVEAAYLRERQLRARP